MTTLDQSRSSTTTAAPTHTLKDFSLLETHPITIKIQPTGVSFSMDVVSARALHTFLEVNKDFTQWIERRIEKYSLIEDQDYIEKHEEAYDFSPEDYFVSREIARFLALVERSSLGQQARQFLAD